ncbi:glycerophosphodiester phosphodiesterase [Hymenobacter sp. BT730]|uniref:glycerophosphodiester phosphodiesterase n=1 Tax=Hymenobacter sp. BT730 TaxID=3063332 RepID=UPI0026DF6DE7|nr:glycerophosphodiester phosphodiesterase [Hymenobacter sp. BT730]
MPVQQVQVLGHAGSGFFTFLHPFNAWPPSSLRGIERALERGADGVEIDIQLSQDSVPILYHNTELSTLTNAREGCISAVAADKITTLRYRGGWPYDWLQQERPQRLDTLLAHLSRRGSFPYLHLDLHETDACTSYGNGSRSRALVRALAAVLHQYQVPGEKILILTNQPETLQYLHQQLPAVSLGLEVTHDFEAGLLQAKELNVHAVVMSKYVATPERCAQVHQAGLKAVIFGGRSPRAIRRLLSCHPDAVEVDNLRQLLRLRRKGT